MSFCRLGLLSPTKATREKGRFLKAKQMTLLLVLLLTKVVKQNSEIQNSPDPYELMINYFDKRFEGKEKKLQHPSSKN